MSAFLYVMSLVMLIKFLHVAYFYYYIIEKWESTKGEIQSYKIDVGSGPDGGWEEQIKYEYAVNGVKFTSERITNNMKFSPPSKNWVRYYSKLKLSEGQTVDVFYNPNNVKDSILDNTFDYRNFILLFFAFVVFIIATQLN